MQLAVVIKLLLILGFLTGYLNCTEYVNSSFSEEERGGGDDKMTKNESALHSKIMPKEPLPSNDAGPKTEVNSPEPMEEEEPVEATPSDTNPKPDENPKKGPDFSAKE